MLKIQLFGSVQIALDQQSINLRPAAQNLLAFLVLYHRHHFAQTGYRRDILTDQLWHEHDEKQARRCLSTTLWRLRQQLEAETNFRGAFISTMAAGEIAFNFDSDHWVDAIDFETKVVAGLAVTLEEMDGAQARLLEDARQLYRGDLLEGNYSDWIIHERERLNLLYLKCLTRLMQYYDRCGRHEESVSCGQAILAVDPLREQVHRHLMWTYAKSGQRILAARQYKWCEKALADELGILPMAETQMLFAQICTTAVPIELPSIPAEPTAVSAVAESGSLQHALQQLKIVMQDLDRLQTQIQQVRQIITQLGASAG
ncbi:MAG: hypothetical protein IAE79_25760 [Anaerolinea sp.]|nr:hypothetical protein [Anaerolinea sp.]